MTVRSLSLKSRIKELFLGVPVFVKVMGIALGMTVVLAAGMLWQIHQTWHGHLVRELQQRGQQLAREASVHCLELSRAGLAADIPAELRHSLTESPDVVYVILQNKSGELLVEARPTNRLSATSKVHELVSDFGEGAHRLRVGMSTARVDHEVGWLTRRLARTTAIIAFLGMLAAWALTRLFAHPLEELVALTRSVKTGSYEVQAPVRANDEVGELAIAFNEMTQAIAQKEAARQQLLRRVIGAGEEERKRIARELHDHTGQALTSQIAALSAMETRSQDPAARERLEELRKQTEQMLSEVHDLSVALRPSVLDDVGLMAALQRHCRLFSQRSGMNIKCAEIGLDGLRLPPEIELTLYRVVQEALTNAARHGKAGRVSALVERMPTRVLAIIQDNGAGFDSRDWQKRCAEGLHLGLLGIEERVTLLGGTFCVESEPGNGTKVYAELPLKEPE